MPALTINHAMVYSKDVAKAVGFYAGLLGMKVLQEAGFGGRIVYARMKSPRGPTTIALHQLTPGRSSSRSPR